MSTDSNLSGAPSAPPLQCPSPPLSLLAAGVAVGLIAGCLLALAAFGVVSFFRPQFVHAFWNAVGWGFGAGIGAALGFTALNWLVGFLDRQKTQARL